MAPVALSAAIGAAAALHLDTIRTLLPALHTSLLATQQVHFVPCLTLAVTYLLTRFLPPILAIPPLIAFPPISAATFPLVDLILLFTVVGLTASVNRQTIIATLAAFALTDFAGTKIHISDSIYKHLPSRMLLPSLIVALTATHLATYSQVLATLRAPKPNPKTRSRRRKRPFVPPWTHLPLVFAASFTLTTLLTSPAASLLRKLNPRPFPPTFHLVAQARGPTGLISIVDAEDYYRILTADMSVLGGYHIKEGYFPDSIFSQFHVHEAVRLTRLPHDPEDATGGREGRSLCIGVGVGVVTDALHTLGSDVDAIELDPIVAHFASRWFGLRAKITVADGLQFVAQAGNDTYDYVVHDVFTGGAVPVPLFRVETFADIRRVMKPDGVLAVNFVGATDHPPGLNTGAVAIVYARLRSVFKHVRAFSDGLQSKNHNIVFFASDVAERVTFRKPVDRDALGSQRRGEMLAGFEQFEVSEMLGKVELRDVSDWMLHAGMWDIATEHRSLMRIVHPKELWPALLAAEKRQ